MLPSPDLLEAPVLTADEVLAVEAGEGRTLFGSVDEASRSALAGLMGFFLFD